MTGGSSSLTLTYDGFGRLARTSTGGNDTIFDYFGSRLLAERGQITSGTVWLRNYAYAGGDEPFTWVEGDETSTDMRWLHRDRLGSVIGTSAASGAMTPYAYGPYGEPQSWSGSRFRYTGQLALPEAQLYHYRARAYDPVMGRFLQTDPIGYGDGPNLYAYVRGDPVNAVDPSGTISLFSALRTLADWIFRSAAERVEAEGLGNGVEGTYPEIVVMGSRESGRGVREPAGNSISSSATSSSAGGNATTAGGRGSARPTCPAGTYTQIGVGGGATGAFFVGGSVSIHGGIVIPPRGVIGAQWYRNVQVSGYVGLGIFLGGGVEGEANATDAPLPPVSGDASLAGTAQAGAGPSVGVSGQVNSDGGGVSTGLPVPRGGVGYGVYAGVGGALTGTVATDPGCDRAP